MDVPDLSHVASATGGGVTVGWFAKMLFKTWSKKQDDLALELKENRIALQSIAVELKGVATTLASLSPRFDAFDKAQNEIAKSLAVLEHRMGQNEDDLNGLGTKVRGMTPT